MRRGFTLLEVVVALLLLEVAVLAAAGTLAVSSRMLAEAEQLERAVSAAEGVVDSLAALEFPVGASRPFVGGELEWLVDASGTVVLRAVSPDGRVLLEVTSAVRRR